MNHRTLAILAALCAIAPAANAEETLTLGAVGNYRSSAYRAYDDSWAALPYIHYNGTHTYINGSSAGVKLYS